MEQHVEAYAGCLFADIHRGLYGLATIAIDQFHLRSSSISIFVCKRGELGLEYILVLNGKYQT
jgi:hypothetical protein